MDPVWKFEHAIICPVDLDFAWRFWTHVPNWKLDPDVESIEFDGLFETGARGVTHTISSGRIEWRIAEAEPGRAVLEFPAPGAVAIFIWTFEDHERGVRITQSVSLQGERADEYASSFGPALEGGIPDGMQRLCDAMTSAAASATAASRS